MREITPVAVPYLYVNEVTIFASIKEVNFEEKKKGTVIINLQFPICHAN